MPVAQQTPEGVRFAAAVHVSLGPMSKASVESEQAVGDALEVVELLDVRP